MDNLNISTELRRLFLDKKVDYTNEDLRVLYMSKVVVSLDSIKEIVRLFPKLEKLDLNTTCIGDEALLEISRLKNLNWLDLSGNTDITAAGIAYLTKLENLGRLDLSLCELGDSCIDSLVQLKNLYELYLSATNFTVANIHRFQELPKLKVLDLLRSNAGDKLPYNLVNSSDAEQILSFISTKGTDDVPIGNYRLILMGEPGCGKTTIYSKLSGDFRSETTTLGINIKEFDPGIFDSGSLHQISSDIDMNELKFNIWDFGGQNSQTPIHELFLAENSIFTIVIEPRMNDCEFSFKKWYDLIKCYLHLERNDSFPLIILFSKMDTENGGLGHIIDSDIIDDLKKEILDIIVQDRIKSTGRNVTAANLNVKFVLSSAIGKPGLGAYLETLYDALTNTTRDSSTLVSKELARLSRKILSQEDRDAFYLPRDLVKSFHTQEFEGVPREEYQSLEKCLNVLNVYGDILYLPESKYVFINPTKLSEILYDLLVGEDFKEKMKENCDNTFYHIIKPEMFSIIFNIDEGVSEALLDLFADKHLLVKATNKKYIIPTRAPIISKRKVLDIISENINNGTYHMEGCRHFQLEFTVSAKNKIFKISSQLSASLNAEINARPKFDVYKNGLVVYSSINGVDEMAVLYEDTIRDVLDIYITPGQMKTGLFNKLDLAIKNLDSTTYRFYAVCPCQGRLKNECQYKYDLNQLATRLEQNLNFGIHCLESNKWVTINQFLYDSTMTTDEKAMNESEFDNNDALRNNNIFIIMPFGKTDEERLKFDAIYNAILETKDVVNEYFQSEYGVHAFNELVRVDRISDRGRNIDEKINDYIRKSSFIITILDGNKPNCYFEHGMARAYTGKNFITLIPRSQRPEFDLAHYTYIRYRDYEEDPELDSFKSLLENQIINDMSNLLNV